MIFVVHCLMFMKPHPMNYLIKEAILYCTVANLGVGGGEGGKGDANALPLIALTRI